jgi:hypothetical protein
MPYADREKQRAAVKRLDAARYLLKKEEMLEKARAWKAANSEHVKTYHREWLAANRPKANASGSRRRALERNLVPSFVLNCPEEKKKILFIHVLRQLMEEKTGVAYHVDHMWPLSDGGPHWSGNLQVIPAVDNLTKGSKVDPDIKRNIKEALEYASSL